MIIRRTIAACSRYAVILGMGWSCAAHAEVRDAQLSGDHTRLVIQLSAGASISAPITDADQVGFADVQISHDRRYVGWTVQTPNCCTSYPLPTSLVVHDGARIVRIVAPAGPPIFGWSFADDDASIVIRQEFPHGDGPRRLGRLRIRDGAPLGDFVCNAYRPEGPRCADAPAWAHALANPDDEDADR